MDALFYKDTMYGGGGAMRGNYFAPIIYSTEEREVGVWKNNKPLYQKTCVFGSVSGQTANLSLGIANIEEAFLCADASYVNDGTCPLPYVTGTSYANNIGGFFDIGVNDTSFAIRIGQSMAGNVNNVVLTVRYTKTTDVAGSGKYNTLGVPNVHYTTDEQVIGTWVDGKPLYEIIIDFGSELSFNTGWITVTQLPHQNKYKLIFDGELISTDGLGCNVDIACNDTTYVEIYNTHPSIGRYLKFKYTKTTD